MKKCALTFLLLYFLINAVSSAQNLVDSRRSSYYTIIFKISNEQAKTLYQDIWNIDTTYFKNPVTSYPTDSTYKEDLPTGHFLFVKTVNGSLECWVRSVNNLNMNLLNNHRDLVMVFNDLNGKELPGLEVEVKSKRVPFESKLKAYRLRKSNKRGLVSVAHEGHVSYFEIGRRMNNTFFVRTGRTISKTFPVNHMLSPVYYLVESVRDIIQGNRLYAPGIYYRIKRSFQPKPRNGYLVLNKPKFKPYDTLRMKGVLTTKKGRLVGGKVDVVLVNYSSDGRSKKIGAVDPFRKGAYQYEFVLSDSLNMKLDQSYAVELRHKNGRRLLSTTFRYEAYELRNNIYSARSEQKSKLKPPTLYLKAEDSNEMPLFDVRADVVLKTESVKTYYGKKVFVSDTLWFYQAKLDVIGETKINIPDSVMPQVAMDYDAIVTFYNTENERTTKTLSLTHDTKTFPIVFELENDTLKIKSLDPQNPVTQEVKLGRSGPDVDFADKKIRLPYSEKVDFFADWYSATFYRDGERYFDGFDLEEEPDKLQMRSVRTPDSLTVACDNPRRIPLRYFLFKNNRLIESAQAEALNINRKAKPGDRYALSVQYVWAGIAQTKEYQLNFDKNNLDIKLEHPAIVYPGQKAKFKVSVHDAFGEPVENVDLTAFAVTRKFEETSLPSIPSYAKRGKDRPIFNEFNMNEVDLDVSKSIQWSYWKNRLGLDSIMFYKLLFPEGGYFEYRTKAATSQFAPFVMWRGRIEPVQVIYVDGQPVYYQSVSTAEPYSFHIEPGEHTIAIRITNSLITLNKVRIAAEEKLFFSVERYNLPAHCSITEMPTKFTEAELQRLSRYFMVVKVDLSNEHLFLQQGKVFRKIGERANSYLSYYERLAGPFYPGTVTFTHKEGFHYPFQYEPFHSYQFEEGLLKMRHLNTSGYLDRRFNWSSDIPSFKDQVLTETDIRKSWKLLDDNAPPKFSRFPEFEPTSKNIGRLTFNKFSNATHKLLQKAIFIVDLNNPDNYFIITQDIHNLPFCPGNYKAIVIFNNEQYLEADSIEIKAYGNNYYDLTALKLHDADTFSTQMMNTMKNWSKEDAYHLKHRHQELQKVRGLFYQNTSEDYSFTHRISGKVMDEEGSVLPGVNVMVKGTSMGTATDLDGQYWLSCPPDGTLVFSFIGYATSEHAISHQSFVDVVMQADVAHLEEVVVVGYGYSNVRKNLTYAVSQSLQGRVPGASVRLPRYRLGLGDSVAVAIRGYSSAASDDEPLVILDGQIVRLQDIDRSKITEMTILKDSEATAIYGSRASNGVMLLTTKPGTTKAQLMELSKTAVTVSALENVPGNALRKNFRDYAFWKPTLRTDQDGHAEFDATFPDDITSWNAHVIGVSKRKTGLGSSTIKSYKPLVAQIAQPLFLITGDTATAIGKITNYAQTEIELERTIKIDQKEIASAPIKVKDSRIDSLQLRASGKDSLEVFYAVKYNDYSDGELRKLPVYRPGTKEAIGSFVALTNDTTVVMNFRNAPGTVRLYAQADLLDVLMSEVDFLKRYPYECNEQQASRLFALLLEKRICAYKNERFKSERDISKMIRKLVANQNRDGSWSWWGTGEGNIAITLHVAKSLDLAQQQGYAVAMNKQSLINYLATTLSDQHEENKLQVLVYLLQQGEKLEVKDLIDSVQRSQTASLYHKLLVQRLKQLAGEKPDWSWIHSNRSQTLKGNLYWGEDQLNMFDNAVHNTLTVYKMMEKENASGRELIKLRNYFLEHRKHTWRNTYESALILEAILPGILAEKKSSAKPALQLTGLINQKVDHFPFEREVTGNEALTISKSGDAPIYFTAYQENWNDAPSRMEKDFVVTTHFEDSPKTLKTGKPVKLIVKVDVKSDAEYVMIEVPIPAGCSYDTKSQSRMNGEVHREYYPHKTNIYCQYLKKGTYTYTVALLPRYSGSYTINPAVVESMYFPTIYGREALKRVVIR